MGSDHRSPGDSDWILVGGGQDAYFPCFGLADDGSTETAHSYVDVSAQEIGQGLRTAFVNDHLCLCWVLVKFL